MLRPLCELVTLPERMEATISLDEHIWQGARWGGPLYLPTLESFVVTPELRGYLREIFRKLSAPYDPHDRNNAIGQGWWIQAEFGAGKSHLLAFVTIMALADEAAWEMLARRETEAGVGRRESLAQFAEGMLGKRIFPLVKNLVGGGGRPAGRSEPGRPLIDYLVEAAQETYLALTGKNLRAFPDELVVGHFMEHHYALVRDGFASFLEGRREDLDDFLAMIQEGDWRDAGDLIWEFYRAHQLTPQVPLDVGAILGHLAREILASGFDGILVVLDEVSEFLRRSPSRQADEDVLLTLAWPLVHREGLPIWTLCAAQERLEREVGFRKIISPERFRLVSLLQRDETYYEIVLARTRRLKPAVEGDIEAYRGYWGERFRWPEEMGPARFSELFPFHPETLVLARQITHRLTTTRSGIAILYDALKGAQDGHQLITPDQLFDQLEAMEEGGNALATAYGLEYEAYRAGRRALRASPRLGWAETREKAQRVLKILFLYHIASPGRGLSVQEVADLVMLPRSPETDAARNVLHFQLLLRDMAQELVQVGGKDGYQRFYFSPSRLQLSPQEAFSSYLEEMANNEARVARAYEALLALDGLEVKGRFRTRRLVEGLRSPFAEIAPSGGRAARVTWRGREVFGRLEMCNLSTLGRLPRLDTPATGYDFLFLVSSHHAGMNFERLIAGETDSRYILWEPAPFGEEFRRGLREFAAYQALLAEYIDREGEEAQGVIGWVEERLPQNLAELRSGLISLYRRGRVASPGLPNHEFQFAENLELTLTGAVGRVLDRAYRSREIVFALPDGKPFTNDDGLRVINGLVKEGRIPEGTSATMATFLRSAGRSLGLLGPEGDVLNLSDNTYTRAILAFLEVRVAEGEAVPLDTLYRNFTGLDWGLTRRMVDIYILSLVRQARLRALVKKGVLEDIEEINYANIPHIHFTGRVLAGLERVALVGKGEGWERIRPFVEVLLGGERVALAPRSQALALEKLEGMFSHQREQAPSVAARLSHFFAQVERPNPYASQVDHWVRFFQVELAGDPARKSLLLQDALTRTFGYRLSEMSEDDLSSFAKAWMQYGELEAFLAASYDQQLAHIHRLCCLELPARQEYMPLKPFLEKGKALLADLPNLVVDQVRLATEVAGCYAELGGRYWQAYESQHSELYSESAKIAVELKELMGSRELEMVQLLDGVRALGQPVGEVVRASLQKALLAIPRCELALAQGLLQALEDNLACPECGLRPLELEGRQVALRKMVAEAGASVSEALGLKLIALDAKPVRQALRRAVEKTGNLHLAKLAGVAAGEKMASYLAGHLDAELVTALRLALREILIVPLSWEGFRPTSPTIQEDEKQMEEFLAEVRKHLEAQFARHSRDGTVIILRWQD